MPAFVEQAALTLSSPRFIVGAVWTGMALLTIALFVLMRTRWGHQQPLSKCIVLSLFAHVLLVAYMTTVHVVRHHPHRGNGKAIRVTEVVGHDTVDVPGRRDAPDTPPTPAPWEIAEKPTVVAPAAPPLSAAAAPTPPPLAPPAAEESLALTSPVAAEAPIAPVEPRTEAQPLAAEPLDAAALSAAGVNAPAAPAEPAPAVLDAAAAAATAALLADAAAQGPAFEAAATPTDQPLVAEADQIAEAPLRSTSPIPAEQPEMGALVAIRPRTPPTGAALAVGAAAAAVAGNKTNDAPHTVPEMYRERAAANRLRIAESYGGSAQTEASVTTALAWLAAHQDEDGRWDASDHGAGRETRTLGQDRKGAGAQADTGITGLALLAFLGAGHTHQAGIHSKTVERGINFLIGAQAGNGNLAGHAEIYAFMYCHGMATLALSEAYAMTGDPRLEKPVRRAIGYTIAAQNLASGGWRYKPNERGDTSQLGWQLMALKSAELGGIAMPERTRQGIVRYLNSVAQGAHGGLASYRPEERATVPMTAEALVCREFMSLSATESGDEAADYLLNALPDAGTANFYYWYYGTLAMFQMQGPKWTRWNDALTNSLTHSQRADGDAAGSWDPDGVWGGYGGRVFSTSLGALCLEVYYRYLPLYGVTASREKNAK